MLITIEGPDRVGKSTLASALRTRLIAEHNRRVVSVHRGAPKDGDHPLRDYAAPIATYSPTTTTDRMTHSMVTDRWHLGDLVYGPIYRGECRQTLEMVAYTDALITARGGVRVHMTADPKVIMRRIEEEGEDNSYLKIADVSHVVASFRQVCGLQWIRTDTTDWTTDAHTINNADELIKVAAKLEAIALPIYMTDSDYVGALRPRFLIVGNDTDAERNRDQYHAHDRGARRSYAAYTPWEGSTAEYLISCVLEAGMDLNSNTGITKTNGYSLKALHAALGEPKVIALGDADKYVNECGLSVDGWIRDPAREIKLKVKNRNRYVAAFREQVRSALTGQPAAKL
jgi:thymidylate kinase